MSGSFEQTEDRFEVTVRLIDVSTGAVLSERTFQSEIGDLIGMERMVVTNTLGILAPRPQAADPALHPARDGPNSTAYYLYLLALGKLAMFQSAPIPDAVELLEQSIKADPGYAPAHASLAVACSAMFYNGMTSDFSWIQRAIASARRAIALDEKSPLAHYALGYAFMGSGEPVEAAREALLALKLDPNHPSAQRLLATLLSGAGIHNQVRLLRARVALLDPSIDVGWLDVYLGLMEGHPDETIAAFEADVDQRLTAGESTESPVMKLGYLAFRTGDSASALRWAATMENVSSNKPFADIIRLLALARTGDVVAVRRVLERNLAHYQDDWEYCEWIGVALALVHEKEDAIEWIERSARLGSYDLEILENAVELDPLRADPRFEAALSLVRGRAREIIQLAAFAGYR